MGKLGEYYIAAFVALVLYQKCLAKHMVFDFHQFGNCNDVGSTVCTLENVKIRQYAVDFDVNCKETSTRRLEMSFEVIKCRHEEQPDSCRSVNKIRTNSFCTLINATSESFSPFFDCIKPRLICPVSKGIYKARNCSCEMKNFRVFPIDRSYQKYVVNIVDIKSRRKWLCNDCQGMMKELREN